MRSIIIFTVLAILGSSLSCKTAERTQGIDLKPRSAKFLRKRLIQNQLQAEWLSAKAKVIFRDGQSVRKFIVNIRYRKDSLIWMNIKKLSVEAARVQITPDSIYIIDRMNNQFAIRGFSYAQREYNLPTGFNGLQSLLLGNPVFLTEELMPGIEKGQYRLSGKSDSSEAGYWLNGLTFALEQMVLDDFRNTRKMEVRQDDFQQMADGQEFSYFRNFNLSSRKFGDISIKVNFSKVELNVPKTIRFEIPERYEKIE